MLPADKGAALTKEKPVEASGAPIQRVNSIPVAMRADGAGVAAGSSWVACAACCAAAATAPPRSQPAALDLAWHADYLQIRDLRGQLKSRDSPCVSTNNAGAGFGEDGSAGSEKEHCPPAAACLAWQL